MPAPFIDKIVKTCGITKDKAEKLWDKAKEIVEKSYDNVETSSPNYFKLVTGVFKKAVGKDCAKKMGWIGESSNNTKSRRIRVLLEDDSRITIERKTTVWIPTDVDIDSEDLDKILQSLTESHNKINEVVVQSDNYIGVDSSNYLNLNDLANKIHDMGINVSDNDTDKFDSILNRYVVDIMTPQDLSIKDAVLRLTYRKAKALYDELSFLSYDEGLVNNTDTKSSRLLDIINERKFKKVVRGGKVRKKLICGPGKKSVGGKCVRMTSAERITRKKSAKKAARVRKRKPKTAAKRSRTKSLRVRKSRGLK